MHRVLRLPYKLSAQMPAESFVYSMSLAARSFVTGVGQQQSWGAYPDELPRGVADSSVTDKCVATATATAEVCKCPTPYPLHFASYARLI